MYLRNKITPAALRRLVKAKVRDCYIHFCWKLACWCCRYVYQKAYVEFFVSPEKLDSLEQRLQKQSSITYMAINSKSKVRHDWKSITCLSHLCDA